MVASTARVVGCVLAVVAASALAPVGTGAAPLPEPSPQTDTPSLHGGTAPQQASQNQSAPPQPSTESTVTRIEVHEDGSATWVLQIRTRLETDEDVEEYRRFQEYFRNNSSQYLGSFSESIRNVVANAETTTGREMAAEDFTAATNIQTVPRQWGVVTYRFTWTNFADSDGDQLVVGDVFRGGYMIEENDTLVIEAPENYTVVDADPEPDEATNTTLHWDGRRSFEDGHPSMTLAPAETDPAGETTSTQQPAERSGTLPASPSVIGTLFGAVIFLLGAIVVARRPDILPSASGDAESVPEAGTGAAAGGSVESTTISESRKDRELLADVDKVERVLAEAGGRLKQTEIGEELDWSKAKTSRVLSRLEDDGRIEKLRLGRENVIDLVTDEDD